MFFIEQPGTQQRRAFQGPLAPLVNYHYGLPAALVCLLLSRLSVFLKMLLCVLLILTGNHVVMDGSSTNEYKWKAPRFIAKVTHPIQTTVYSTEPFEEDWNTSSCVSQSIACAMSSTKLISKYKDASHYLLRSFFSWRHTDKYWFSILGFDIHQGFSSLRVAGSMLETV